MIFYSVVLSLSNHLTDPQIKNLISNRIRNQSQECFYWSYLKYILLKVLLHIERRVCHHRQVSESITSLQRDHIKSNSASGCKYIMCVCILTGRLLCSPVAGSRTETRVPERERERRSAVSASPKSGTIWEDRRTRQRPTDKKRKQPNTADERTRREEHVCRLWWYPRQRHRFCAGLCNGVTVCGQLQSYETRLVCRCYTETKVSADKLCK